MAAEERLGKEQDIEMQRTVIIGRVVAVEPAPHHLIDEPPVDPLVEMRRLDAQEKKTEKRAQGDDSPEGPIEGGEPLREGAGGRNFPSRGLVSAAR